MDYQKHNCYQTEHFITWALNGKHFMNFGMEQETFYELGHWTGNILWTWVWNRKHFTNLGMEREAFYKLGYGTGNILQTWVWNRKHFMNLSMERETFYELGCGTGNKTTKQEHRMIYHMNRGKVSKCVPRSTLMEQKHIMWLSAQV